jgi:hypothetical protein
MVPEKIAILCSDIHLSDKPPIARSDEPDWYEAMARPLRELRDLAGDLPVLCGGDLFDRWRSPPKLINFAMRELPQNFYSVMGQHDMPYHSWEERRSSAFWTLKTSLHLKLLARKDEFDEVDGMWVRGFHWGRDLVPNAIPNKGLKIAVAHKYCWNYTVEDKMVATEENNVRVHADSLAGFGIALFGDNHKGFSTRGKGLTVFNAGTFMRRASDEIDYRPMVGILYEDGTVEPHYLDTSREVMSGDTAVRSAEKMIVNIEGCCW